MKVSLLILSMFVSMSSFAKNGKNYRLTESIKITVSSTEPNACIRAQHNATEKLLVLAEAYCNQHGLVVYEDLSIDPGNRAYSYGIEVNHDVIKYNTCSPSMAKVDSEIRFKCVRN